MGFTAFIRLNRLMGLIGAGVYDRVGHHPAGYEAGSFQGQSVLAIRGKQNGTGYPFRLRPEIVAALIELGFSAHVNDAASLPGEIGLEDVNTYLEGRVRPVWVNAVERNRQARLTCLGRYGYTCFCCGVDLQAKYGLAKPFVHVHHLRALALIGEEYEVDPIADLRPVCPNCHAVIHLSDPPLDVVDVRARFYPTRTDGRVVS